MKRFKPVVASLLSVAVLAACGGGGGASNDNSVSPNEATAKYIGTWTTAGCFESGTINDATTQALANTKETFVFTRLSGTKLSVANITTVYASSDSACSGTPLGTIESTGATQSSYTSGSFGVKSSNGENSLTIDGTATVSNLTVDQITSVASSLTNFASKATVTAGSGNRFTFQAGDFGASTSKSIARVAGNELTVGVGSGATYPTVLDVTNSIKYIKATQ